MNLARTESAYLAEEESQVFDDAQKRLGAKMLSEFKYHSDNPGQLCHNLCELEQFRCFTPKMLLQILEDAKENQYHSQITASPYVGHPIFGSHD
jgi:hypothetical protein